MSLRDKIDDIEDTIRGVAPAVASKAVSYAASLPGKFPQSLSPHLGGGPQLQGKPADYDFWEQGGTINPQYTMSPGAIRAATNLGVAGMNTAQFIGDVARNTVEGGSLHDRIGQGISDYAHHVPDSIQGSGDVGMDFYNKIGKFIPGVKAGGVLVDFLGDIDEQGRADRRQGSENYRGQLAEEAAPFRGEVAAMEQDIAADRQSAMEERI